MNNLKYIFITLLLIVSCSENESTDNQLNNGNGQPKQNFDARFYSSAAYKVIGEANELEMLSLNGSRLNVVGLHQLDYELKIGNPVSKFFDRNLKGLSSTDIAKIDSLEISSDLTGEDNRLIVIQEGKVTEIKETWP